MIKIISKILKRASKIYLQCKLYMLQNVPWKNPCCKYRNPKKHIKSHIKYDEILFSVFFEVFEFRQKIIIKYSIAKCYNSLTVLLFIRY